MAKDLCSLSRWTFSHSKNSFAVFCLVHSVVWSIQLSVYENASQAAEIVNGIYGLDTVIAKLRAILKLLEILLTRNCYRELANRRGVVVFHKDKARPYMSVVIFRQKVPGAWLGKFQCIHHIVGIWYQAITIFFSHCKTS
ncbi:uncharacterized protein LOC124421894 isoform X2 [Vespa crabro]|uniref:uncharacterized protein LOC124421894 isoform X2 n=1 Tax=Vespa crabro TaxID=7445 RepID=UPI001F01FB4C|nr:uncharacterized protein LOC124421894 isoform X2 [Vespa crabro]